MKKFLFFILIMFVLLSTAGYFVYSNFVRAAIVSNVTSTGASLTVTQLLPIDLPLSLYSLPPTADTEVTTIRNGNILNIELGKLNPTQKYELNVLNTAAQFTTAEVPEKITTPSPIYGQVIITDKQGVSIPDPVIAGVFLDKVNNNVIGLSARTTTNGTYSIDLSSEKVGLLNPAGQENTYSFVLLFSDGRKVSTDVSSKTNTPLPTLQVFVESLSAPGLLGIVAAATNNDTVINPSAGKVACDNNKIPSGAYWCTQCNGRDDCKAVCNNGAVVIGTDACRRTGCGTDEIEFTHPNGTRICALKGTYPIVTPTPSPTPVPNPNNAVNPPSNPTNPNPPSAPVVPVIPPAQPEPNNPSPPSGVSNLVVLNKVKEIIARNLNVDTTRVAAIGDSLSADGNYLSALRGSGKLVDVAVGGAQLSWISRENIDNPNYTDADREFLRNNVPTFRSKLNALFNAPSKPAMAVIMFGTNDCAQANLDEWPGILYSDLTSKLEGMGVVPLISTVPNVDNGKRRDNYCDDAYNQGSYAGKGYTKMQAMNAAIGKFALEHNYPLRVVADYDGLKSRVPGIEQSVVIVPNGDLITRADLGADGTHIGSAAGYSKVNDYTYTLVNALGNYLTTVQFAGSGVNYVPVTGTTGSFGRVLNNKLLPKAFAQNTTQTITTNTAGVQVSANGTYEFADSDKLLAREYVTVLGDKVEIKFFVDKNNNGLKDTDESDYSANSQQLTVQKVASEFRYQLKTGWNFWHFPFVANVTGNSASYSAAELLNALNLQGANVSQIVEFKGGKFNAYIHRAEVGVSFANDFNLVPGRAYFVKSLGNDIPVSILGQEVTSGIKPNLETGWNSIGFDSTTAKNNALTAVTGLEGLDKGFVLSKYSEGLYTSLIKEDGVVYGSDFPLANVEGYFLRK